MIDILPNNHPDYLIAIKKYSHLLQVSDRINIKPTKRFIRFDNHIWSVYTQPIVRHASPRIYGRYDNVLSAIFHATGGKIK